jgi:hypothetical protein
MSKSEVVKSSGLDLAELNDLEWQPIKTDSEDLRLPGIHLVTSASELAKEGKVQAGTFVNLLTKQDMGKEIIVVPFFYGKVWRRYNTEDKLVEVIEANTRYDYKWKREEDPDGFRNEYCYDFYVLSPGVEVPMVVSFKATNADEGRKLVGVMAQNGSIPCRKAIKLFSTMKNASNRKWMAKDFTVDRDATREEILTCHKWQSMASEYHKGITFKKREQATVVEGQPHQPSMF